MVELVLNKDLLWENDWDGSDVGYADIPTIGCYRFKDSEVYCYINMETMKIVEIWGNTDLFDN